MYASRKINGFGITRALGVYKCVERFHAILASVSGIFAQKY